MKSPFPGMDPFIEARGLWTDFHDNLIVELQRALNEQLPPHYEALLGERTYIDLVAPENGGHSEHLFKPDVRIDRQPVETRHEAAPDWTGAASSVVMHAALAAEEREPFIEIRGGGEQDVVTCIELLSPSNKRPGSAGSAEYERKRQLMFRGAANFVEIDLLRGGRRRAMREPWPDSPYYVLVMRKDLAPECRVFRASSVQPLPPFPIPLAPPDPDLTCDLQSAVEAVLARSRYERRLRYDDPIDPPLRPEEAAFLRA